MCIYLCMYHICKTLHTHIIIDTIAKGSYNVPYHYITHKNVGLEIKFKI